MTINYRTQKIHKLEQLPEDLLDEVLNIIHELTRRKTGIQQGLWLNACFAFS